jgi:hypothetical protein
MTPNYTKLWKLLDVIIYDKFYLDLDNELYPHPCTLKLLPHALPTEDTIAYVYNRETI